MQLFRHLFSLLSKPAKPVPIKPVLVWGSNYLSRNPEKDGHTIVHYAYSAMGTFEIYDSYDAEFGTTYLLCYAPRLKMPADLFYNIDVAKAAAGDLFDPE